MLRLDSNLIFTIINLLILYIAMKKLLIGRVLKIMEKRQEMIDAQFKDAENTRKEADELKAGFEGEIAALGERSAEIMKKAQDDARAEYDRIVKSAGEEADRIVRDAKRSAELEKKTAMDDVQTEIASLAMSAVEKIIGTKDINSVTSSMYDEFISETGDNDDTDSN